MKTQIETYQREIDVHKEVEKELAKRSHFCQKVIKRLKGELEEATQNIGAKGNQGAANMGILSPRAGKQLTQNSAEGVDRGSEDLINFLEQKLEQAERNMVVKQQEYDQLLQEYQGLQGQFNQSKQKYKRAALLLTEFLDDILNATPNILQPDRDLHLNLEKIKETPLEELPKEDKVSLVLVLLKQLQPYLSTHNLNAAPPVGNIQPPGSKGGRKPAPIETGAQRIGHRANSSSQHPMSSRNNARQQMSMTNEEEGINRILNNINVQSRKAGDQGGSNLPPIQ